MASTSDTGFLVVADLTGYTSAWRLTIPGFGPVAAAAELDPADGGTRVRLRILRHPEWKGVTHFEVSGSIPWAQPKAPVHAVQRRRPGSRGLASPGMGRRSRTRRMP